MPPPTSPYVGTAAVPLVHVGCTCATPTSSRPPPPPLLRAMLGLLVITRPGCVQRGSAAGGAARRADGTTADGGSLRPAVCTIMSPRLVLSVNVHLTSGPRAAPVTSAVATPAQAAAQPPHLAGDFVRSAVEVGLTALLATVTSARTVAVARRGFYALLVCTLLCTVVRSPAPRIPTGMARHPAA